jgi:AcrR family transcriptional regulator
MKPRDENKIQDIYQATLLLVRDTGLAGVTMSQIAKSAGLATGTVYIYFKNKEELINSLFAVCRKASTEIYFSDIDPKDSFKEAFRKVWFNIFQYRTEKFEEAIFLEQCYHSPFINAGSRKMSDQLLQPLFSLMEQGKKERQIRNMDTSLLLATMIGSISETIKHSHYNHKKVTKSHKEQLFEFCWEGLKDRS